MSLSWSQSPSSLESRMLSPGRRERMERDRSIGERIREARKREGVSQRELAAAAGVSVSLVRKLEQGERQDTRIETLRKMAVALAVPTTALSGEGARAVPVVPGAAWEPVREALAHSGPASSSAEPVTEAGL